VLDAGPLADTGNVGKVYRVIRNGVVYEPEKLMQAVRQ
jgi:hypothetical protein